MRRSTKQGVVFGMVMSTLYMTALAGPPSGTEFTYQGQLKQNGSAVTATCDITLGLFDVESDGVSLATDTFYNVAVINGLFTVQPDFGADPFDMSTKYLEVAVDCDGSGDVTMTPRQKITPAPKAIYSQQTNGITVDGQNQVAIGTTLPGAKLTISRPTQEAKVQLELRNEGSIQTPNFDGIAFTQNADGSTELASMKVIYKNNGRPDLSFSVRDQTNALYINGNNSGRGGNVGIGTTTPAARLHVNGDIKTEGNVIIPPTTRYLMIGAADMVPQSSSMAVYRSFAGIFSFFAPAGQQTTLYAPVHLPDGATVTELRAFLHDNVPDDDVFVSLEAQSRNGGTQNLAVIFTEGTPGTIEAVDDTIENAVIDNSTYAYFLRTVYTVPPVDGETHFRIRPVRIAYEVTDLLP